MDNILNKIEKQFKITNIEQRRKNLAFFFVQKEIAISVIVHLRDYEGFKHLVLLTAVDWIEDNKFQLTYLLNNPEKKSDIGVKVLIDRENPEMESIHHLWKQAKTYQRELREMFGINFPGSPKVEEPFILEGWTDIPPYRKDFDTKKYSEETYFPRPGRSSNDPATYMKQKLYPDE